MFKIQRGGVEAATIQWPVTVNVPQDHGNFKRHTFTASFQIFGQEKIDDILAKFKANDTDMVDDVLVGWEGVADSDDNELAYNKENKKALIDIPYVRTAIVKAYFEMVGGAGKAKN